MSAREKLRAFVEQLPEDDVVRALRLLESLHPTDPWLEKLLTAEEVDEPLTEEERRALEQGLEEIRRGEVVPWEKVREEVG